MQITFLSVKANHVIEIKFDSTIEYLNPFFDISPDVIFTDPLENLITVPAYQAGDYVWVVRYSSRFIGKHTYHSACTDTKKLEPTSSQGVLEFTDGDEYIPLLTHGAPKISADVIFSMLMKNLFFGQEIPGGLV